MSTIKSLRMQSGYTQRELANKCSMNIRHIQKLESGEVDVGSLKAKSFMMLAQTLDISPYDLIQLSQNDSIDFVTVEPLENNFHFSLKRINGNAILSARFCPENTCRRKMTLRKYQEFAENLPDFVIDVDADTLNRIIQFVQNAILRLRMK